MDFGYFVGFRKSTAFWILRFFSIEPFGCLGCPFFQEGYFWGFQSFEVFRWIFENFPNFGIFRNLGSGAFLRNPCEASQIANFRDFRLAPGAPRGGLPRQASFCLQERSFSHSG